MKVLPSLLRKGKGRHGVFLKARGDEKEKRRLLSRTPDGSFPSPAFDVSNQHSFTSEPPTPNDSPLQIEAPKLKPERQQHSVDLVESPPILPSISYPPLSEEPNPINLNSLQSPYQYADHPYAQELTDPYQGIKKYYQEPQQSRKQSDHPGGTSYDCYDEPLLEVSPVGVDQFESLPKFQGGKGDVSLLGMQVSTSHSVTSSSLDDESLTSFEGIAALEELTKSQEPDVYMDYDEDNCDIELESGYDNDFPNQDKGCESAQVKDTNQEGRSKETSTLEGTQEVTLDEGAAEVADIDTEEEVKAEEEDTAFFSDCEYDTKADESVNLAELYAIKREIKVAKMQFGEKLDTIDETSSQGSRSQFNDDESMASSYLFSLVDDDEGVIKKRRRKVRAFRRRRQKQGPLFSPALMDAEQNEEGSETLPSDKSTPVTVEQEVPSDEPDVYAGCPCSSISFDKMREDAKSTYVDATKAFNQVLYAFFVVQEDVSAKSDNIRGSKFGQQEKALRSDERQFSQSMLV